MKMGSIQSHNRRENPLQSLVDDGTITKEQETSIRNALEKARMNQNSEGTSGTDPLQTLVDDGTITEDQLEAVKTNFEKNRPPMRMGPPPGMKKGGNEIESTLTELEENGTITEDQLEAILEALNTEEDEDEETSINSVSSTDNSSQLSNMLQDFVDDGTISEDAMDKILENMNNKDQNSKLFLDAINSYKMNSFYYNNEENSNFEFMF
jgi:competence protein ComGC